MSAADEKTLREGQRVRVMNLNWLQPWAGEIGVIEEMNAGVEGRHRVAFAHRAGSMRSHGDFHADELLAVENASGDE